MKFAVVTLLKTILERFIGTLSCLDQCFVADETLEQLPSPTQLGKTKVGGIDLNKARLRWVAQGVLTLSTLPAGFTASPRWPNRCVGKVDRGKLSMAHGGRLMISKSCAARGSDVRQDMSRSEKDFGRSLPCLHSGTKLLNPCLPPPSTLGGVVGPAIRTPIDTHYQTIRMGMQGVFHELGIAA